MISAERYCIYQSHENYQVKLICTFKECDYLTRWVCCGCLADEKHKHGQDLLSTKYLINEKQFIHIIQERKTYYDQKLDKVEKIKDNLNKLFKYFIQQLEACQIHLKKEKQILEKLLKDQFITLSEEEIYNRINSDIKLAQWVNLETFKQLKQELNNNVELLLNESFQIKKQINNQYDITKEIMNSAKVEGIMQQHKRDKEIQIKSCINHQILVIKEIGDYITDKRQELNSWENLIYQISESFFTLQQEIRPLENQQILLKQRYENHQKQIDQFNKIIIGQEKIDLKQQKQFIFEKQIQLLTDQLSDIIITLKSKQDDPENTFLIKWKLKVLINKNKKDFQEDKIELLQANKINMKDLYDEFKVSSIIEQNQEELEIQINENSEFTLIQQGLIQLKQGFYEQSTNIFEKVIKLNPINSRAYHCKANSLALLNQNYQADELYSQAIKLDPYYESCYLNKVRNLYMNWKLFEQAADELLIEIKIKFPNCKKIYYIEQYQKIRKSMKKPEENKDRQY